MKFLLECLVALILHPLAVVLSWINIAGRVDMSDDQKVIWVLITILWGIGPILYILIGGGTLW